jgi:hypothetical protein
MTALTEAGHAYGFLISEAEGKRSRENRTLLSGQNLKAGHVVGKVTLGAVTSAAKAGGNTGNGTHHAGCDEPEARRREGRHLHRALHHGGRQRRRLPGRGSGRLRAG